MTVRHDDSRDSRTKSAADARSRHRDADAFNSTSRDGSREHVAQRQVQDLVNGSQRTRDAEALQDIVMNSRGAARNSSVQAMADRHVLQKTGRQGRKILSGNDVAQLVRIDVPAQLQNVFGGQYIDTKQMTLVDLEALYEKVVSMNENPQGATVVERQRYQALLESVSVGLLDAIVTEDYKEDVPTVNESGSVDGPLVLGEPLPQSVGEQEKKAEPIPNVGQKPWAPTIGGYYWKHILEGHALGSDAKGKSKWGTEEKEVLKGYVDAVFEENKGYLKPHHFGQKNRRLWGQLPDIVGVEGKTGAPTKGVIIWVHIERAYGRCKIMSAYPGEY